MIYYGGQYKVQVLQFENGKYIGREYQEWISSDCQDGGDRIESKKYISCFNYQ